MCYYFQLSIKLWMVTLLLSGPNRDREYLAFTMKQCFIDVMGYFDTRNWLDRSD